MFYLESFPVLSVDQKQIRLNQMKRWQMSFTEINSSSPLSEILQEIKRLEALSDPSRGDQEQLAYLKAAAAQRDGQKKLYQEAPPAS